MTLLHRLRLTRNTSSLKWIAPCGRPFQALLARAPPERGERDAVCVSIRGSKGVLAYSRPLAAQCLFRGMISLAHNSILFLRRNGGVQAGANSRDQRVGDAYRH